MSYKDIIKHFLFLILTVFFYGIVVVLLQFITFFIQELGFDMKTASGMFGGMLFMVTLKWFERKSDEI